MFSGAYFSRRKLVITWCRTLNHTWQILFEWMQDSLMSYPFWGLETSSYQHYRCAPMLQPTWDIPSTESTAGVSAVCVSFSCPTIIWDELISCQWFFFRIPKKVHFFPMNYNWPLKVSQILFFLFSQKLLQMTECFNEARHLPAACLWGLFNWFSTCSSLVE